MADSSFDREMTVLEAKLAQEAKLYDEMVTLMNEVAKNVMEDLTADERDLLSEAYKNVVGPIRDSLKTLALIRDDEESKWTSANRESFCDYVESLVKEIRPNCDKILELIDELIPKSSTSDAIVFYYKMKGDYSKYLAEVTLGSERTAYADAAHEAYLDATLTAVKKLPCANPIRLSLALNLSLFYLDILQHKASAKKVAKVAYDEAMSELGLCEDKDNNTLISHLLQDLSKQWE